MAYARIPAPGSEYGPCAGECAHRDCAANRAAAAKDCRRCGKPIGYDVAYFADTALRVAGGLVHADCEYDAIEREQKLAELRPA